MALPSLGARLALLLAPVALAADWPVVRGDLAGARAVGALGDIPAGQVLARRLSAQVGPVSNRYPVPLATTLADGKPAVFSFDEAGFQRIAASGRVPGRPMSQAKPIGIADLDGDGRANELVVVSEVEGGGVWVFDTDTLATRWRSKSARSGALTYDVAVVLADVDDDPGVELLFVAVDGEGTRLVRLDLDAEDAPSEHQIDLDNPSDALSPTLLLAADARGLSAIVTSEGWVQRVGLGADDAGSRDRPLCPEPAGATQVLTGAALDPRDPFWYTETWAVADYDGDGVDELAFGHTGASESALGLIELGAPTGPELAWATLRRDTGTYNLAAQVLPGPAPINSLEEPFFAAMHYANGALSDLDGGPARDCLSSGQFLVYGRPHDGRPVAPDALPSGAYALGVDASGGLLVLNTAGTEHSRYELACSAPLAAQPDSCDFSCDLAPDWTLLGQPLGLLTSDGRYRYANRYVESNFSLDPPAPRLMVDGATWALHSASDGRYTYDYNTRALRRYTAGPGAPSLRHQITLPAPTNLIAATTDPEGRSWVLVQSQQGDALALYDAALELALNVPTGLRRRLAGDELLVGQRPDGPFVVADRELTAAFGPSGPSVRHTLAHDVHVEALVNFDASPGDELITREQRYYFQARRYAGTSSPQTYWGSSTIPVSGGWGNLAEREAMAPADFNGDGQVDLFVLLSGPVSGTSGRLMVFRGGQSGGAVQLLHDQILTAPRVSQRGLSLSVVDLLTGPQRAPDGLPDLLIRSPHGARQTTTDGLHGSSHPAIGREWAPWTSPYGTGIASYLEAQATTRTLLLPDVAPIELPADCVGYGANILASSRDDLFLGCASGRLMVFEPGQSEPRLSGWLTEGEWTASPPSSGRGSPIRDIAIWDIDGVGLEDVVVGTEDGWVVVFSRDSGELEVTQRLPLGASVRHVRPWTHPGQLLGLLAVTSDGQGHVFAARLSPFRVDSPRDPSCEDDLLGRLDVTFTSVVGAQVLIDGLPAPQQPTQPGAFHLDIPLRPGEERVVRVVGGDPVAGQVVEEIVYSTGRDRDGDGNSTCGEEPDCDDTDPDRSAFHQEACNGFDDDCDGVTDPNGLPDAPRFWPDLDGDGWGDALGSPVRACVQPIRTAQVALDCDDSRSSVNPASEELVYNGLDDDCDPESPDDDLDEDGFPRGPDCDDTDPNVHPGTAEVVYNGLDDDCDPATRDDDLDGDGYVADDDCDDTDPDLNPGAEEVPGNGLDDDCDPSTSDEEDTGDSDTGDSDSGGSDTGDSDSGDSDSGDSDSDSDSDSDATDSDSDTTDSDSDATDSDDSDTTDSEDTDDSEVLVDTGLPGDARLAGGAGCACATPGATTAPWPLLALAALLARSRRRSPSACADRLTR